jgi:hypothetical protein
MVTADGAPAIDLDSLVTSCSMVGETCSELAGGTPESPLGESSTSVSAGVLGV